MVLTLVLLGSLFRLGAGSIKFFIENDDNTAFFPREKKICKSGGAWVSCNSIYVFDLWNNHW
jgi:hypothetical protein